MGDAPCPLPGPAAPGTPPPETSPYEAIANAPDGDNVLAKGAELLTQPGDACIEGTVEARIVVTAHVREQEASAEHLAWISLRIFPWGRAVDPCPTLIALPCHAPASVIYSVHVLARGSRRALANVEEFSA
jgi:hypothetical protein